MSDSTFSSAGLGSRGGAGSSPSSNRLKILPRGDACWSCRRRKLRCDGNKPICGPCRRYQRPQECIFDEKPLSEVQLLEKRVSELESLLQAAMIQQQGQHDYGLISSGPSPTSPSAVNASSSMELSSRSGEFPRPNIALLPLSTEGMVSDPPITPELTNILLDTYFARLYLFNFAVDVGKFRRALQLPENDPHRPHPALLNAMYCLACHYADDVSLRQLEPAFHDRAQRHLDDSLAHVDRLFDFLAATTLLAQYHIIKGNLAKGSYLASSAMSFAVGCGLHQTSSDISGRSVLGNALLPPPENLADYLERVNVFSSVFQIERQACLESGVPLTLADELITTPWPMPANNGNVAAYAFQSSLSELFSAGCPAASVQGDVVLAVRAKAIALLERATREARYASMQQYSSTGDGRFWESYQCIDQALACFRDSLPPVDATMFSQSSVIDNESAGVHATTIMAASNNLLPQRQDWLEFTLTFAHVSAAAAVIQLHGIFSDRDESETSVVLAAARDIAGIIRTIGTRGSELNQSSVLPSFDPRRHHKLVYYGVLIAAQVLCREHRRRSLLPTSATTQELYEIKTDLDLLSSAIDMMAACYPGSYRDKIELRRAIGSQYDVPA